MPPTPDLISVVAAFLNERDNLRPLCAAVAQALDGAGLAWELILVDDGSTDGSSREVKALHGEHPQVRLIKLSRNFGQQVALSAGLDHARGAAVVTLDADLQHPPSLIPSMIEKWRKGVQVVNAIRQEEEKPGLLKRATSKLYMVLFGHLTGLDIRHGTTDFRLMDRVVVEQIRQFPERHRFLRGLVSWVGFTDTQVEYAAPARSRGRSKYTPIRMLRLALDGITSFSVVPLHLVTVLGFVTTSCAFAYLVYVVVQWARGMTRLGWPSLMAVILLLGGAILLSLGIIGQYVGRIYTEVKGRPLYVVEEAAYFEKDGEEG